MISLDNFENVVPYKIVMRGEEYFDEGAVSELEETSQGEWIASVTGTEDYEVEITIAKNEVTSWFCDCPYDGEICKHVVATMFAIRENNQKANNSMFSRMNVKESEKEMSIEERQDVDTPDPEISQLLAFISHEELSSFVLKYASKHSSFKEMFMETFFSKIVSSEIID